MTDEPKPRKGSPCVVVADDDETARVGLGALLEQEGFRVLLAEDGPAALARVQEFAPDALVTDLNMPGIDGLAVLARAHELSPELVVVLMTASTEVEPAVRAMKEGAEHYLMKPVQLDELLVVLHRALEGRRLRGETVQLRARIKQHLSFDNIIGASPAMQEVFNVIEQVAPSKASVLITGESGTGKELVAQAVHGTARARRGPS